MINEIESVWNPLIILLYCLFVSVHLLFVFDYILDDFNCWIKLN
jgi:hypothetical protein